MKDPTSHQPHRTGKLLLLTLGLGLVGLMATGCSPGSASMYQNPNVRYIGPGYGSAGTDMNDYSSGLPIYAGQNVNSWYGDTRP
ncbi:MAG: hypothetical protein AAGK14_06060 [Verrucomicrobiota bacterium]